MRVKEEGEKHEKHRIFRVTLNHDLFRRKQLWAGESISTSPNTAQIVEPRSGKRCSAGSNFLIYITHLAHPNVWQPRRLMSLWQKKKSKGKCSYYTRAHRRTENKSRPDPTILYNLKHMCVWGHRGARRPHRTLRTKPLVRKSELLWELESGGLFREVNPGPLPP